MRISELPNLGSASERMLEMAGISTAEELDEIGSVEAYRRVSRKVRIHRSTSSGPSKGLFSVWTGASCRTVESRN